MVITKDKLQQIVNDMPDKVVDIEEVFDKILLSAKIEEAKRQIANGEVVDWEDVKKEMDTW